MIDRRPWMGWTVVFAAALLGCSGGEAKEPTEENADTVAETGRRVNVRVERIEPRAFTEYARIVGSVEADRAVTVAAEEGGTVRALHVERGANVDAGHPLVKIDDQVLRTQVRQAEAEAALAEERYERQRRLWEEERVGTEINLLEARYTAERARANAEMLATRLDRTTVRAPIAGRIEERHVEVGTMVSPGAPVARLVDLDTVRVAAGLPERGADGIEAGSPARITFDVLGEGAFDGRVAFVGAVVDTQNRTLPVEVVVPNPDRRIKPGMVANVRIERRRLDGAILVPQEAVLRTEDGYRVYVVEERNGRSVAAERTVVPGTTQGGRVVVAAGVEPGDRLIVVGQNQLAEGDAVKVIATEEQ